MSQKPSRRLAVVGRQYMVLIATAFGVGSVASPAMGQVGDMNCDGAVNFFDIDPFLLALFDRPTDAFCNGDICAVDIDCSGAVDFFDIDPFVGCLFATCPDCP